MKQSIRVSEVQKHGEAGDGPVFAKQLAAVSRLEA